MNPVYCSTGAFIGRANGRDYGLIPSQAALLDCDGCELMIFGDWYSQLDALIGTLAASGLRFPVVHIEKTVTDRLASDSNEERAEGFRLFAENCRVARAFSAFTVLHLWNGMTSAQTADRLIGDALPRLREIAETCGVELTIENIPNLPNGSLALIERIAYAHPEQRFTLDMRHAAFQEETVPLREAGWLWSGGLVRHIHVSDFIGPAREFSSLRGVPMPGDGQIDFDAWFAFLVSAGYDGGFTLESNSIGPHGIADPAAVNRGLAFIRDRVFQY